MLPDSSQSEMQVAAGNPAAKATFGRAGEVEPSRAAMQALNRWAAAPYDEGRRMTVVQRAELISLAEHFMSPDFRRTPHRERAKLGRVQALYIAGMLACFDPNPCVSPFRNRVLVKAYCDMQGFARGA